MTNTITTKKLRRSLLLLATLAVSPAFAYTQHLKTAGHFLMQKGPLFGITLACCVNSYQYFCPQKTEDKEEKPKTSTRSGEWAFCTNLLTLLSAYCAYDQNPEIEKCAAGVLGLYLTTSSAANSIESKQNSRKDVETNNAPFILVWGFNNGTNIIKMGAGIFAMWYHGIFKPIS